MEPAEEPKTEAKPDTPEDPRAFVVSFFKEARKLFAKEEIENCLWITKKGVFVRLDLTNRVIEVFQRWFQAQIGEGIPYSLEKAEKKLFHEEVRKEYYLIIGNSVVVGNLLECSSNDLRGAGIRLYEGIPLDTATNLHHADPIFFEEEGLKAHLEKTGYAAVVQTRNDTFVVPFELFPRLREYFVRSGEMRKYITAKNIRSLVQSFCYGLNFIKPLGRKQMMLLPSHLIDQKGVRLWSFHTLMLVEEEGVIKDFIPLAGRSHDELMRRELHDLAETSRGRRIGGASISLVKGSFLAHSDVAGIHHKFGVSVVLSFLEEIDAYAQRNHSHLPGKLRAHFTARDLVTELAHILREAAPCTPDKVPGKVREGLHRDSLVLISRGEWYFVVDRQKMIRSMYYVPKVQRKEVQIIQRGPKDGTEAV